MSELKVHRFITTDELFPEANAEALYYDKSEADKVIAELDRQIKFLKITHDSCGNCNKCADGMGKVFDESLDELKAQKAQTEDDCAYWKSKAQRERHHKYKRCLAMARWCKLQDDNFIRIHSVEHLQMRRAEYKRTFYRRWHKRWLKIADKYKEGNV